VADGARAGRHRHPPGRPLGERHGRRRAGVPRLREGLGWINAESRARFGAAFPDATPAQRIAIVEDIAWPAKAKPAHRSGVQFFNAFRDLCASGFYTTRMGVKDLGYAGNVPLAQWTGCPAAANRHLGT
jgi:hypothetical protein